MISQLLIDALIVAKLTSLAVAALPPGPAQYPQAAASRPALAAPKRSGGRPIVLQAAGRHTRQHAMATGPRPGW